MFSELDHLLDSFLEMGIPGLGMTVLQHGKCVYRRVSGWADPGHLRPITGYERYHIYSCSKPVTVTAALQLWEKGLFQLEDPLYLYIPEFRDMTVREPDGAIRPARNPIRILDLFRMTAGLSYNLTSDALVRARKETNGECPTVETIRYLAQDPLMCEPSARYEYSLCHDVLAALVEVLSGEKFEEYVDARIFKPLGMSHSTFLLPADELDTITNQYRGNADTGEIVPISKDNPFRLGSLYASGGAGMVSTMDDYLLFLEALREGERLLKRSTIQEMITNRLTEEQRRTYALTECGYGYGLGVRCPDGGATDFGWGGAAGAYLAVDLENDYTFFYAQHVLSTPNAVQRRQLPLCVSRGLAEK